MSANLDAARALVNDIEAIPPDEFTEKWIAFIHSPDCPGFCDYACGAEESEGRTAEAVALLVELVRELEGLTPMVECVPCGGNGWHGGDNDGRHCCGRCGGEGKVTP